jgi:hypothetical protein
MNVIKEVFDGTQLRRAVVRQLWTASLLIITKRTSSQSVHLNDLTMDILIPLCCLSSWNKNNADYLSSTRETSISEQYIQSLPRKKTVKKSIFPKDCSLHEDINFQVGLVRPQ